MSYLKDHDTIQTLQLARSSIEEASNILAKLPQTVLFRDKYVYGVLLRLVEQVTILNGEITYYQDVQGQ